MTRKSKATKPEKPVAGFPLTAHPCGQWCKKVHGKLHFFGVWEEPYAALAEYERRLPLLKGGAAGTGGDSIRYLCNALLDSKEIQVEAGEMSKASWNDYKDVAERLVSHFGPGRPIDTLRPLDFENLWASLPRTWSHVTRTNFVIRVKVFLNYAYNHEMIDKPIRTGSVFKRSTQKKVRIERANAEKKFFSAAEIQKLVATASTPQYKAMILCGVNLGFGNADCGRLTLDMINFKTGWVSEPRHKTGIHRMGKLWPETLAAIQAVLNMKSRKENNGLVFVNRLGNPYWTDGGFDNINTAFYRITKTAGLRRMNVGFYSLRHVTQTIGDQAQDPIALRILMGHVDPTIAEKYREHFDRSRVEKVCNHIRKWYLKGAK